MRDLLEKIDSISEAPLGLNIQTQSQREKNIKFIDNQVKDMAWPTPDPKDVIKAWKKVQGWDLYGSPSDDWTHNQFFGRVGKRYELDKFYTFDNKVVSTTPNKDGDFEEVASDKRSAVKQNRIGLFPKNVYDSGSKYKFFVYNTKPKDITKIKDVKFGDNGSTGEEPETSSKNSQDLATWYDQLKDNPDFKKAKIPPPPKEKKNIPTWYDELQNNPEFKKGTIPDPYGQDDAERDLTSYKPEKAKANRYKQDYVGGVPDEVSNVKTIDDPGREEGWYKNNNKRAQAKTKASSYSSGYGSGDQQYSKGQVKVKWNGTDVPQLSKDNWQDWIKLGNELLSRYVAFKDKSGNESVQYKNTLTIAESIRSYINTLTEKTEMSDQDKANWEVLQKQFSMFGKSLPPEAQKAYRDLQVKKRDYDISGIDSGPFDDNRDFGKDRYEKETYGDFYDIIQSVLKNTNLQTIQAAEQKIEKMNKEFRNLPVLHSTMKAQMYGSIAKRLGWKGIFNLDGKTVTFAETTPRQPNFFGDLSDMDKRLFMNGEHVTKDVTAVEKDADMKKIAYKQFRLGFLPNAVIPKFINKLNSADPNSEEKTATGGAPVQVTLSGNKTLPPLTSATVNDYVTAYLGILRKYKSGTGKGGGNIAVSKVESKSNSIRQYLNILHELESKNNDPNALKQPETAGLYNQQRSKISSNDIKDLEAIENAFKTAQQRKAIKPAEHTKFTQITKHKEQLFKKLDAVSTRTKGETPDAVKDTGKTTAPYGIFNDQVMAVIGNPTPENLIKQADAAAAMDLDGWDTEKTKLKAVYGHVAKALRLPGIITHKNSFWDGPMVVYPQGSSKTSELFPFGEYEWEDLDWENPKHKKIGQSQADKNLLPSSIEDTYKRVDDVFDRLDIKEPTDAEKDDDSAISQRERYKEKIRKDLEAKQREEEWGKLMEPPPERTDATDKDTAQTATSPTQPQKTTPELPKINSSNSQYKYSRFVPISDITNINSLLALPKSVKLFVDRVPRGDKLNIVSDAAVKQFLSNGKYKIARQTSPEESPDAYNAITDYLDKAGLGFTDEETAQRWQADKKFGKKLEPEKDDDFPDRVGGPGDNAYQMGTAGKDKDLALARINDKPEEPPAPEAQPEEEPPAAGTDQDLRPNFSQSMPTGNVFSIAQDSQGWYVTKIGPKGKQYRMSQHYKDKTKAENSAKAKASSTNSKYEPYDDNQTVDASFGGSSSEQDDLKLISQWNTQADNLLNILNNPNSSDSDKKRASSTWMNGENIDFLNELLKSLRDPAQRQKMSLELQDAITKMHQKEKSINDIYKKLTGQTIDNKEIERLRTLATGSSQTEPKPPATGNAKAPAEKPAAEEPPAPEELAPVKTGVGGDSSSPDLTTPSTLSLKTSWSVIPKDGKFYISNGKIENGPFDTEALAGAAADKENAKVAANLFKPESAVPGEMIYNPEQAKYVPATGEENAEAHGAPSAEPKLDFQPMKDAFYKVISSPDPDTQEPRWMVINIKETNPSLKNSGPVFLDKSQADNAAAQANAKINDSTNFTRLLKNAGLLKEFY